jgi:hypothetical protein
VDIELAHKIELVRFDRLCAEPQQARNDAHRFAFGKVLHDLGFARR